ncbi:hypothetical protein PoB_005609700 [Plakobranchus ocellatus]|uniref:Uncharacterized protein n=1 Tax=Plakobranchus ocellatus TaxID=259542 RepID=A0AAV4CDL0_9GAST|nr:hypothetical protein PoB_005609700 [Plakobranchus ocellatus]
MFASEEARAIARLKIAFLSLPNVGGVEETKQLARHKVDVSCIDLLEYFETYFYIKKVGLEEGAWLALIHVLHVLLVIVRRLVIPLICIIMITLVIIINCNSSIIIINTMIIIMILINTTIISSPSSSSRCWGFIGTHVK